MDIKTRNLPVAETVSELILEKGFKQSAGAKKIGVTNQQCNDMRNGRRVIKVRDIPLLAQALGVTPNQLFRVEEKTSSTNT